MDKTLIKY